MKKWYLAGKTDGTSVILHDEHWAKSLSEREYDRLSPCYDTKEEMLAGEKIPASPCNCCGSIYSNRYTHKDLSVLGLCFSCDLWEERAQHQAGKIIVNGRWFSDGGAVDRSKVGGFLGHGGHNFKIEMFDGRIIETNNLWSGGDIPERFRSKIPDNAKFLR